MFSSLPSHALLLMNLNSPGGTFRGHTRSQCRRRCPSKASPQNPPLERTCQVHARETLGTSTVMSAVNWVTTKGATHAEHTVAVGSTGGVSREQNVLAVEHQHPVARFVATCSIDVFVGVGPPLPLTNLNSTSVMSAASKCWMLSYTM